MRIILTGYTGHMGREVRACAEAAENCEIVAGVDLMISASEGIGERSWKKKRSKLSKRASTRWDELMVVR